MYLKSVNQQIAQLGTMKFECICKITLLPKIDTIYHLVQNFKHSTGILRACNFQFQ